MTSKKRKPVFEAGSVFYDAKTGERVAVTTVSNDSRPLISREAGGVAPNMCEACGIRKATRTWGPKILCRECEELNYWYSISG